MCRRRKSKKKHLHGLYPEDGGRGNSESRLVIGLENTKAGDIPPCVEGHEMLHGPRPLLKATTWASWGSRTGLMERGLIKLAGGGELIRIPESSFASFFCCAMMTAVKEC